METLFAVIYVQGFIWGALLLRKRRTAESWLGLAFLVLGIIYFLDYSEDVYQLQVPIIFIFSGILLLLIFTGYYQYSGLVLPGKKGRGLPPGTLIIFILLVLVQALVIPGNGNETWILAGSAGTLSVLVDSFILIRRIRKKTHTGNILDLSNYLLHFHILAFKVLFTLNLLIAGFTWEQGQDALPVSDLILQGLFAAIVFSTGYHAVQFPYVQKPIPKSRKMTDPASDMVKRVSQMMEEKKPYLDCELTLGKMADLLEMSEYELTGLLHTEMQTSFYDLINGYRMAAVKEKLLEPDSKKYTILSAAYESGFNSSSTFYRIFKEHTGMQPKAFIERKAG
jgi:AraC-like DNA-binding protein